MLESITATVFLAVTTILLVADLKQPKRFHFILFRPQWRSWLTRGAFILLIYGALLALDILLAALIPGAAIFRVAFYLTILFAAGSAVYSAFLFGQAKGRDFWQSPLFAVHLLVMAVLAGAATMISLDDAMAGISRILFVAIVSHGVVVAFDLMAVHSTNDAKIAARYLYEKNLLFWIGGVFVGIIVPLLLLLFGILGPAGLIALIGLFCYERAWVRAGQVVPLS